VSAVLRQTMTLSRGERVSPKATGEGVLAKSEEGWPQRPSSSCIQRSANLLYHPVQAAAHVVIREADLQVSGGFDVGSPDCIEFGLFSVVLSVDFDSQLCRDAREVDDMAANRHLPTEFNFIEPPISELLPQQVFGGRFTTAEPSRDGRELSSHVLLDPANISLTHPTPSPGCFAATLSPRERVSARSFREGVS